MSQTTDDGGSSAVDYTPEGVDRDDISVEYSRHGSERLRRFFRFLGISSPLDDQSKPDDDE